MSYFFIFIHHRLLQATDLNVTDARRFCNRSDNIQMRQRAITLAATGRLFRNKLTQFISKLKQPNRLKVLMPIYLLLH